MSCLFGAAFLSSVSSVPKSIYLAVTNHSLIAIYLKKKRRNGHLSVTKLLRLANAKPKMEEITNEHALRTAAGQKVEVHRQTILTKMNEKYEPSNFISTLSNTLSSCKWSTMWRHFHCAFLCSKERLVKWDNALSITKYTQKNHWLYKPLTISTSLPTVFISFI